MLIGLCVLPGVLHLLPISTAISIPVIEELELLPLQINDSTADGPGTVPYLSVYTGLILLLVSRTLWRWLRLQRARLVPTAEPDVFTTTEELPPLTLSWPRRAVVIPLGLEAKPALIRHERAHLRYFDAEITLLLLLLQDVMLRNPGISFLVRQWRLSIELRADQMATKKLARSERKDYAALLLNIQRPSGDRGKVLPCPTARLSPTHRSNTKIRLVGIIEGQPAAKKRRWGAAIFLNSICASAIGLSSAIATVNTGSIDMQSSPIDYARKMAPLLPAKCPRFKTDGVLVEERPRMVDGQLVPRQTFLIGTVLLNHDVRRDGAVYNPRTVSSTHSCLEENAKAVLAQWRTEPQEFEVKDAAVKLYFEVSGETVDDIKVQINDFFE